MKKTVSLFFILFTLTASVMTGQIQLSATDMYRMGSFNMALDATGGFDPGTPGGNKTWDFSGLENQTPFAFNVMLYNGMDHGNEANLAIVEGEDTSGFIQVSGSDIFQVVPLQDFQRVIYWKRKAFSCPVAFNSVNGDSILVHFYHSGDELGIDSYDSVKLSFYMVITSVADAWGTIKLPTGDFSALRIKTTTNAFVTVWGKNGQDAYAHIPSLDQEELSVGYQWYTKDKGNYLAAYDPENEEMRYQVSAVLGTESVYKHEGGIQFANPVDRELKMHNTGQHACMVSIYDMNGRLVQETEMEAGTDTSLVTETWLPGVYGMVILDKHTQSVTYRKLLK